MMRLVAQGWLALACVVVPVVVAVAPSSPAGAHDDLFSALRSTVFYSNGTAHATDVYEDVEMSVSYNEPDNVTCSHCGWAVHSGWTYPWQTLQSAKLKPGAEKLLEQAKQVRLYRRRWVFLPGDCMPLDLSSLSWFLVSHTHSTGTQVLEY